MDTFDDIDGQLMYRLPDCTPVLQHILPVRGFVFDLDGTLVLPDKQAGSYVVLPGAVEILGHLRAKGLPFVALTNNTMHTPVNCSALLRKAGVELHAEQILTPSSVAAEYFRQRRLQRVLVIGDEGVWRPLADAGLDIIFTDGAQAGIDAVYVGYHPGFNSRDIEAGCRACWSGARLFVSSAVPFFATQEGRTIGISRAIGGAISSMTGCRAMVLGKPSPHALRLASRRLGVPIADLAVIGDDPRLEIIMARNGGAYAIAVETGIGRSTEFTNLPPRHQPHLIVSNIGELLSRI